MVNDDSTDETSTRPSWFLDIATQDVLPVFFRYSSRARNNQDTTETLNHLNIYLTNDVTENRHPKNIAQECPNKKPMHLLAVHNNFSEKKNWIFCNRVSVFPLFLNEIITEKRNILFVMECSTTLLGDNSDAQNDTILLVESKPHLIVKFSSKKKKTHSTNTLKLCPYLNSKICCFHQSDKTEEVQAIDFMTTSLSNDSILNINTELNYVQYLCDMESLKAKTDSENVTISAILIEAPLGNQKLNMSKFSIYEA